MDNAAPAEAGAATLNDLDQQQQQAPAPETIAEETFQEDEDADATADKLSRNRKKLSDFKSLLPTQKARNEFADRLFSQCKLRLVAMYHASGVEYVLHGYNPNDNSLKIAYSSGMQNFMDWTNNGQLVRSSYSKYCYDKTILLQDGAKLRLRDLSHATKAATAKLGADALLRNRKAIVPYKGSKPRSQEELDQLLQAHLPWWLASKVPYIKPHTMTDQELETLIAAMVSECEPEDQRKVLAAVRGGQEEYPSWQELLLASSVIENLMQESWAKGKQPEEVEAAEAAAMEAQAAGQQTDTNTFSNRHGNRFLSSDEHVKYTDADVLHAWRSGADMSKWQCCKDGTAEITFAGVKDVKVAAIYNAVLQVMARPRGFGEAAMRTWRQFKDGGGCIDAGVILQHISDDTPLDKRQEYDKKFRVAFNKYLLPVAAAAHTTSWPAGSVHIAASVVCNNKAEHTELDVCSMLRLWQS